MTKLSEVIVETFVMGTVRGDHFMELQTIFQNYHGDNGATPITEINTESLRYLFERGFIVSHSDYLGRFDGYVPTTAALNCMYLQLAHGGRSSEPRDAFDARLVVRKPEWAEYPSGLGVEI